MLELGFEESKFYFIYESENKETKLLISDTFAYIDVNQYKKENYFSLDIKTQKDVTDLMRLLDID